MGISFSQQISRDITNGYLEVINQLTASVTTDLNQNVAAVNQINLTACGIKECGAGCHVDGVNLSQGNQVTSTLSAITLQNVTDQVKNRIQDTTTQFVKATNTAQQSWLSFAFGINIQDQTTINNFSEKIKNLISNTASTTCSSQIILANNANVVLCNVTKPSNVAQNNTILAAQSCIAKQIVSNILSNTELFNGMQTADQQNYDTQGGPLDFLYYIGLFVFFIIIVVVIAGTIRYATRGPKQKKPDMEPIVPVTTNDPNLPVPIISQ